MNFLIMGLLAGIFYAAANLLDKFLMSNRTGDPLLPTIFTGLTGIIPAGIIAFYFLDGFNPVSLILAALGGLFMLGGNFYYFYSLKTGDVSDMTVLSQTSPLFVFLLSIIFLNQSFSIAELSGFTLLLLGGILAAGRNADIKNLKLEKATALIIFSTILFSVSDIFLKVSTNETSFWMAYSAALIGRFGGSAALLTKQRIRDSLHHLRKKKMLEILIPGRVLFFLGFLSFMYAVEIGKVSLVTALLNIRPIIVMASLLVMAKVGHDHFQEESLGARENLLRVLSVILFVAGVLLLK